MRIEFGRLGIIQLIMLLSSAIAAKAIYSDVELTPESPFFIHCWSAETKGIVEFAFAIDTTKPSYRRAKAEDVVLEMRDRTTTYESVLGASKLAKDLAYRLAVGGRGKPYNDATKALFENDRVRFYYLRSTKSFLSKTRIVIKGGPPIEADIGYWFVPTRFFNARGKSLP